MAKVKWPDFLILGAAKAGTTALYHQLNSHPEIFMSVQKEMNYFALKDQKINFSGPGDMEGIHRTSITRKEEYLSFFSATSQNVMGEVSPLYLYSPIAPKNIFRHIPHVKLIICLRNPVHRAYSAFLHLRRDNREMIKDFQTAFNLDEERKNNGWAEIWHYRSMGLYGKQLQRYFSLFNQEQILCLIYEDFLNEPENTLKSICEFLGVNSSHNFDFGTKYNKSGTPRFQFLHQILIRPHILKKIIKKNLPKKLRTRLREKLLNLNLKSQDYLSLDQMQRLFTYFEKDIQYTEELIKRDLSHWKPHQL